MTDCQRICRRDEISDLPRIIIESILERMTIRDAARTSILSTKWRCIWTTLTELKFDSQFFEETLKIEPIDRLELVSAVEKVIMLHKGPIQKLILCLPKIPFDCSSDIDRWMLFLSRNRIKDLTLNNTSNIAYKMHSCIYSCPELARLTLVNCILEPPRELRGLQNVSYIHFSKVTFGHNMLRTLLSRFPLLEILVLEYCNGSHLNIHAPNLKILYILYCTGIESISFVDTRNLIRVVILVGKTFANLLRGKRTNVVEFLVDLPRVVDLQLDSFFLELSAAGRVALRLPNRLYSLAIYNIMFSDLDLIANILYLIRSCRKLTKLTIRFGQIESIVAEHVVKFLEAPPYMDQKLEKLISVRIKYVKGLKPELLFIKLLLACTPMLETMFVELSQQVDVNEGFRIVKELARFPRLSPKLGIICGEKQGS